MSKHRIPFLPVSMVMLLGTGLASCGDGSTDAGDHLPALASQAASADCVDFQGLPHCPLGNARLVPIADGRGLEVTETANPDSDGVSIILPEVTNFAPDGRIEATAPGSTLNVRALSGGKIIGTLSLIRTDAGVEVSALFTGDSSASTFNLNLYNQGAHVGTIAGFQNGTRIFLPYWRSHWWWWWRCWWCWWWWVPHFWNTPPTGACVWSIPFPSGEEVQVVTADGRTVVADRIELEEVVSGAGSYPYLTFDRIDYTTGGGILLSGENIENRP